MVDRGVGAEHAGLLDDRAELGDVVVDRRRLHHVGEHVHLVGGEVLHEPEVEERHAPVAVEQVVAGVRVAVERPHPVQAAEHETEDRLGGEVAFVLVPGQQLVPGVHR